MTGKRVAVIGANGFIGTHLSKLLNSIPGIQLYLYGKNASSVLGDEYQYQQLDITDGNAVNKALAGTDLIYYLASASIPASTWENPTQEIEKNLLPFLAFMEGIAKISVPKIAFISSAGTIYGPTGDKVTEDAPKNPFNPHGITKLTMEYFLNYFHKKYGLVYDTYRVSNVYGAGQSTGKGIGLINTLLENILNTGSINIFGDGSNVRNYLYAKDLAKLLTLSLHENSGLPEIYNASSHDSLTINQVVDLIKEVVPEPFAINYTPVRQSDNSTIFLDNSKILNAFPSFQFTPVVQGIGETYQHIKQNKATIL